MAGSNNYGLDDSSSDLDTKAIVLPHFVDIVRSKQWVTDTIINAQQELIAECDVFVDGPFVEELKNLSLAWRGSSNQRVIDVQKSLKEKKIVLYCD